MASSSDVLKQGYVKIQSKKLGVWKKRWLVLRKRSSAGQARLEKYKEEACFVDAGLSFAQATVVELRYVDAVARLPESIRKYGVCVIDRVKEFQFSADSEVQANDWMEAIKEAMAVSSKTQNSYKVHLMRDVKLKFHGECTLFVTSDTIKLLDIRNSYEIVAWPFNTLRRYGVERNQFQIEAGRSSETGEGVFNFDAEDPEAIYHCVHDAAQKQVQQTRRQGNNTNSSRDNGSGFSSGRSSDRTRDGRRNVREEANYGMGGDGGSRSGRHTFNNNYTQDNSDSGRGRSNYNAYSGEAAYGMNRKYNDLSSDLKKTKLSNGTLSGNSDNSLRPQVSSRTQSISSRATDDSDDWADYQGDTASVSSYTYTGKSGRSAKSSTSGKASGGRMSPDYKRSNASDYSYERNSDIRTRPLPIPRQRPDCTSEGSDYGGVYDTAYSHEISSSRSSNKKK